MLPGGGVPGVSPLLRRPRKASTVWGNYSVSGFGLRVRASVRGLSVFGKGVYYGFRLHRNTIIIKPFERPYKHPMKPYRTFTNY